MRRPRSLRILVALASVAVLALVLAPAASANFFSPESPETPNAAHLTTLWWIIFALSVIVFVGVEGALIYAMVRYRARRGTVAAQIHGNTPLEIGWTVGAAAILVVIAAVTFGFLNGIRHPVNTDRTGYHGPGYGPVVASGSVTSPRTGATVPPDGKALTIKVNGQQYIWRFVYPDGDRNPYNNPYTYEQMTVPTHTTVELDITSQDVAHSWWIPQLGGKFDAVPGYTNHTWFKIDKPGYYRGQCAELCGRNHANMIATVHAIPASRYAGWLAAQERSIAQAQQAASAARRQLFGQAGSNFPGTLSTP